MFIIENNFVYEIKNKTKSTVKKMYGNINKVGLTNISIMTNMLTNIPVTYQAFNTNSGKYETDTDINKTVDVYLDGNVAGQITITNGNGNIEFESAEAGTYKITVDGYSAEVAVV